MVLSESQFQKLLDNETYIELLVQAFLHKSILFLGFSFYDPAIKYVFEQIENKFGAGAPGRHIALLPETNASELIQKANRLNISVVKYDAGNKHEKLWHGVTEYATSLSRIPCRAVISTNHPHSMAKQYLAACYARSSVVEDNVSLREIVLEGVLSEMLQDAKPKSIGLREIYEKARLTLGIKGKEISKLVDSSLKVLVDAKLARKHKDEGEREAKYAWIGETDSTASLDDALQILQTCILNRAHVQEGWKPPMHVADTTLRFLKEILHKRGWDLGAAFASGRAPDILSIHSLLAECSYRLTSLDMERIERTIESVFQRPTDQEARILGELGRVSFMLELAFQAPRTTLLYKTTLPRKLYFDTNVLLPTFVDGHPHNKIFKQTLRRLQDASIKASNKLQMLVFDGYLNEMICHRSAAVAYAKEAAKDFDAVARSDAIYHGSGNINVYVGAYVNSIEYGQPAGFERFLNRVAPYHTEAELRRWIEQQGFIVIGSPKTIIYGTLYGILEKCNANRLSHGKEPVLVEHDALQMGLLEADHDKSEKALFITADRQLFEDILNSDFGRLADFMVSHIGIVQLVDLIIGFKSDDRVLGELLWNSNISEPSKRIRSYLTVEALSKYDAALAMKMHEVIEAQSEVISKQLKREGANLDTFDPKARVNGLRALGTLESNFFTGMSEAIEKLRGD